jgi:hypothetical protein
MNTSSRRFLPLVTVRPLQVLLIAAGVLALFTRVFDDFSPARLKLVEHRLAPVNGVARVNLGKSPTQPTLSPPLALILRASSLSGDDHRLSVAVDGRAACTSRVTAARTKRIDCVVKKWNPGSAHEITIASDRSDGWAIDYVEVATHHGNSTGFNVLYVLPAGATNYRTPSISLILGIACAILGLLLAPTRHHTKSLPVFGIGLTSVVVALLAVAVISPWVSPYVVILSLGTFIRWLALALLVNVINACQWVCNVEDVHRPALRVVKSLFVGLIVTLIFGTVLHRQLKEQYNGNYSGFLKVSRSFFETNPLVNLNPNIKSTLILLDNGGYDGQLMYFAAFDPFLRAFKDRPSAYEQVMGAVPAYRYGRIGFSLLTRMLSGGRWQLFPAIMMWIILCSLGLSSAILAWFAQGEQRSAALGAVVLLIPGFWASLQAALPEPLAAATLLAGFVCLRARRPLTSAAFFAVSLLVRETGMFAVLGVLAWILWNGRRRDAVLVAVGAFTPLILWRCYVWWILWPEWGMHALLYSPPTGRPFAGVLTMWQLMAAGHYWPQAPHMATSGAAFPVLLFFAIVLSALLFARRTEEMGLGTLLYGISALSLDYSAVWAHVSNAERTTYELFVLLALGTVSSAYLSRPERRTVVAFWCAAALYTFGLAVDADYVRSTIVQQLFRS